MNEAFMTGDLAIALQQMAPFRLSLEEMTGSIEGLDEDGSGKPL